MQQKSVSSESRGAECANVVFGLSQIRRLLFAVESQYAADWGRFFLYMERIASSRGVGAGIGCAVASITKG